MKLIVGLGNPGESYRLTRHNVGFWVIDELVERLHLGVQKLHWKAFIWETRMKNEKVILCKPQTYMNLSGESIREICKFYREMDVQQDLILIYDDMDFQPGQVKLRQQGRAGGHNGVKSVIECTGTDKFNRIRLGIGRPNGPNRDIVKYVLDKFDHSDEALVQHAVGHASEAVLYALENSFEAAMNRFNE